MRILAAVLLIASCLFWFATGANRGWTKTSVPVKVVDEITGIEGVSYQNRFVPGVDLLVAGALASMLLAAASFLFRRNEPTHPHEKSYVLS
jgi:hypothetical protein